MSASGRSRTKLAKAALISRLVLALKTWACSPMARAAASTSLNMVSGTKLGLTSTATRLAAGTNSRRSSSRFAANSSVRRLMPVRFPPGRARLATRPLSAGSAPIKETIGIVVVAAFAADAAVPDHGDLFTNQFGRQRGQPIDLILGPTVFDRYVLALDIAGLFQSLAKCAQKVHVRVRRCGVQEADDRHRRLLRIRRERPRRRPAE